MRKLSQSEVERIFEDQDCKLLSQYKDSNTSLEYVCSCGNKAKNNLKRFRSGARCKNCGNLKSSKTRAFDYEYVREYFESNKCTLLSNEYKNSLTPLRYRCCCGNISEITFVNFRAGHRCRKCSLKIGPKNHKWNPNRGVVKENESLRKRCYNLLHRSLKSFGKKKVYKTSQMLGFTSEELRDWINQEKFKQIIRGEWHLDHVFPIKAFVDYGIQDLKLINCLENLQPVPKQHNLNKQGKYCKKEFESWLTKKRIKWL